jgi:hypothetical protein
VLIVACDPHERDRLIRAYADQHDISVACSPLEVIRRLETDGPRIATVVMSDVIGSVGAGEMVDFLREMYPWARVLLADRTADLPGGRERPSEPSGAGDLA